MPGAQLQSDGSVAMGDDGAVLEWDEDCVTCCDDDGGDDETTYCSGITCSTLNSVDVTLAGIVYAGDDKIGDATLGTRQGTVTVMPGGTYTCYPTSPGALTFVGTTDAVVLETYSESRDPPNETVEFEILIFVEFECPVPGVHSGRVTVRVLGGTIDYSYVFFYQQSAWTFACDFAAELDNVADSEDYVEDVQSVFVGHSGTAETTRGL